MKIKINWDALGISASLLCAVHCALLPLFFASLPILGIELIHNALFEYGMIFLALCVGIYALRHGWKKHHRSLLPVFMFIAGISFLFAKEIWHEAHLFLLIPAVVLIVSAHIVNYVMCQKAGHYNSC